MIELSRFGVGNQSERRPKLLVTRAFRPLLQIFHVCQLF